MDDSTNKEICIGNNHTIFVVFKVLVKNRYQRDYRWTSDNLNKNYTVPQDWNSTVFTVSFFKVTNSDDITIENDKYK